MDQHIAHERILYEKLSTELQRGEVPRQQFLLPVRIELPFESAAILAARREDLARIGIVLDEFGGGTFLLREYPSLLAEGQTRYGFQGLIEQVVASWPVVRGCGKGCSITSSPSSPAPPRSRPGTVSRCKNSRSW